MTNALALSHRDGRRLALFLKTAGKGLIGEEIDEALEWIKVYNANPFTKEIYFFLFGKHGEDDRKVVPVLSITKYRQIADGAGNYRPDENPPRFTYDEALKGPGNPAGIVDCEVCVMKYSHGSWHPIRSKLKWVERAPLLDDPSVYDWVNSGEVWKDSGKPKKTKRLKEGATAAFILDPKKRNWHTMPETMLAKCVEADAIRKGWPKETAGSYGEGEMDAADSHGKYIDLTAEDVVTQYETDRKLEMIGGTKAVIVDWCQGSKLDRVPHPQFADAVLKWARERTDTATELQIWWQRNEMARAEFKAAHGSDYLEFQRQFETLLNDRRKVEAAEAAA